MDILRDGLVRFHRNLEQHVPSNAYPATYRTLIDEQNMIGWDQVYKGRWSREWGRLQESYARRQQGPHERQLGKTWVMGVGRLLIDQWLKVWTMRNADRHGVDLAMQMTIRERVVFSKLEELYTYKDRVCPTEQSLFYANVEVHRAQTPSLDAIENWILTFKEAIVASASQAARLGITRNRTITEYPMFNPIS